MDHKEEFDAGRLATTDGSTPKHFGAPAPDPTVKPNGQHGSYWVLSEAERAKGFVRPVRDSYKHVGRPGPQYPLRDMTPEETERHGRYGYVKFEQYPDGGGRFWTQLMLDKVDKGCGTVTRMGRALAETYAREPGFYGATFCVRCRTHPPVGADGEFVWEGTTERVGT